MPPSQLCLCYETMKWRYEQDWMWNKKFTSLSYRVNHLPSKCSNTFVFFLFYVSNIAHYQSVMALETLLHLIELFCHGLALEYNIRDIRNIPIHVQSINQRESVIAQSSKNSRYKYTWRGKLSKIICICILFGRFLLVFMALFRSKIHFLQEGEVRLFASETFIIIKSRKILQIHEYFGENPLFSRSYHY